jgi:hypothetical protein
MASHSRRCKCCSAVILAPSASLTQVEPYPITSRYTSSVAACIAATV